MDIKPHIRSITILCGLCILLFFNFIPVYAQNSGSSFGSPFDEGESLFRSNQPEKAVPFLEKALAEPGVPSAVYNYLGTAYMQTGNPKKALDIFLRGTKVSGTDKKSLYYNAGSTAFLLGDYTQALEYFSFRLPPILCGQLRI